MVDISDVMQVLLRQCLVVGSEAKENMLAGSKVKEVDSRT